MRKANKKKKEPIFHKQALKGKILDREEAERAIETIREISKKLVEYLDNE